MKVLIVSRFNSILPSGLAPFIDEQAKDLIKKSINVDFFIIKGRGIMAYFKAISELKALLKSSKYDIVHAHYGLSGIVSVLQREVPVVVSLIGCDVNLWYNRLLNRFTVYKFSTVILFVSEKLKQKSKFKGDSLIIPYGIDLTRFYPIKKLTARKKIKINEDETNILFASRFDRPEKNYNLAKESLKLVKRKINLIEFKNIAIEDLNYYYNACDLFLMTSIREGSPQSIKEAMACNIPIVSTNVGDVKDVIGKTEGCFISSFEPEDVASKINAALYFRERTTGREDIKHLESSVIAKKIINIYNKVLEK